MAWAGVIRISLKFGYNTNFAKNCDKTLFPQRCVMVALTCCSPQVYQDVGGLLQVHCARGSSRFTVKRLQPLRKP